MEFYGAIVENWSYHLSNLQQIFIYLNFIL